MDPWGGDDKQEAQEKLRWLNHVLSYPTTIFIDKQGKFEIKLALMGPATGDNIWVLKEILMHL